MIKVYDKNEQKFVTNGLVVLDNCKSLFITEQLNGQYELEMEYPIDSRGKWKYLAQDNIIEADGQLFRIYKVNKKDFNSVVINARHIFYDLLDNLVEDVDIRGLSGADALEKVMSNIAYVTGFTWMSDITATNNIYLDDESGDITGKNPVDAIMFLVTTYSGELLRDNFNIKFLKSRGQDRGMLISYGKNIKGIEEDINIDSVITRIKPVGQDGLTLDEKYVDSPHIGDYAHPKISQIEFSDDNDYDSLRADATKYFTDKKCDIPQVNYKVTFTELRKTEEYRNYAVLESVYLGDTVTVRVKKLNIDVKCEVIKIKKNVLTDRIEEIELGNFKRNLADSINKTNAVVDVFGGAIANGKLTKSFLQSWVDNATNLIIKSNNGHVLTDENGYNIMDTTDKATAKNVWRFDMGGLGFSSTGYNGPFGLALTNDGAIVADRITAGELNGAIIKGNSVKTSALELEAQQEIEKGKFSYDQLSVLGVGLDNKVSLGEVVLVPKETKLQVSRAGPVINPLNTYNFNGGTAVLNNTLVAISSGSNDYNYSAGLEVFGDTEVTYNNPNDRIVTAETEIKQQGDTISLVAADGAIKGAAIVSAINVSGSKISESALDIDLTGFVTFNSLKTSGQTEIDGGNITTGYISADRIQGGTISGALLRTSNTSNYMLLHEQYLEVYHNASPEVSIGYIDLGNNILRPAIEMPSGKIYSGESSDDDFAVIGNNRLALEGMHDILLASYTDMYFQCSNGNFLFTGNSMSFNGSAIATQSYVSNVLSGCATENWVQSQGYQTHDQVMALIRQAFAVGANGSFTSADGKHVDVISGLIDSIS